MKIKSIVIAIMMLAFTAQAQFMRVKWSEHTSSVADSTGGYIPFVNGIHWRSATSGKFLWTENGVIKGLGVQGGGTSNQLAYFSNGYTINSISSGTTGYVLTSNGSSAPSWQPASGGITNSATTNEIPKTNASGNLISSGFFSTTDGNILLGASAGTGSSRSFTAQGSSSNIGISIISKGVSTIDLTAGTLGTVNFGTSSGGSATLAAMGGTNVNAIISSKGSGTIALQPNGTGGVVVNSTGLGYNVTPSARALEILYNGSSTNSIDIVGRFQSSTSGTPASGIGTGIEFSTKTATSNSEIGASISSVFTSVTSTAENADMVFKTMASGATAAERVRFASTGAVGFNGANYGNSGEVLTSAGPSASPSWSTVTFGGLAIDTIQIGDWNIDATQFKSINLTGMTYSKIRDIQAMIRNDSGVSPLAKSKFPAWNPAATNMDLYLANVVDGSPPTIILFARTGSAFDSTDYDATSYNRGWVIVYYVP